jgi:outer membrane protein assembly factor BamB
MAHPVRLLLALLALSAAASSSSASDWPQFRGPARDGLSTETGWLAAWPPEGPKVLWRVQVGLGYSAVSVAGGRLYTLGAKDKSETVWCLNADTGEVAWRETSPFEELDSAHPGPRSTPTVEGGRVYTLGAAGRLAAWDAASGKPAWSVDLYKDLHGKAPRHAYNSCPLVLGNRVIVEAGADDGNASIVAFDKTTGSVLWKSGKHMVGNSSPIAYSLGGETFVAVFTGDALVGLKPDTGQEVWVYPWKIDYESSNAVPIVAGSRLFISAVEKKGAALLDLAGGEPKEVWKSQEFSNHFATSVLWKGCLYGLDGDIRAKLSLRCVDFETGAVKWAQAAPEKAFGGNLAFADGKLIVLWGSGEMAVCEASPEGYKELSKARLATKGTWWTVPVLAGGRLYVRSAEGDLLCLDLRQ